MNKILNAPERSFIEQETLVHSSHEINSSLPVSDCDLSCEPCKAVYRTYVSIGQEKSNVLSQMTEKQNSELWLNSRKFRITSTKVTSLPKTSRGDPNKFVTNHINNRFKGPFATRHGQKCEPLARNWFEQVTGESVTLSGIVVCPSEPYLAASLDGIVDSSTLLEIKCPTKPVKDLIESGKYDVMLKDGEHVLNPKGKNAYYTQVQFAMHCTGTI